MIYTSTERATEPCRCNYRDTYLSADNFVLKHRRETVNRCVTQNTRPYAPSSVRHFRSPFEFLGRRSHLNRFASFRLPDSAILHFRPPALCFVEFPPRVRRRFHFRLLPFCWKVQRETREYLQMIFSIVNSSPNSGVNIVETIIDNYKL